MGGGMAPDMFFKKMEERNRKDLDDQGKVPQLQSLMEVGCGIKLACGCLPTTWALGWDRLRWHGAWH